jgi:cytochrome c oxidase assembly protein subunit 15
MLPQNTHLHRFSVILAACTLFLIVAGGLVVTKQAGLSVPDWPLSYGKVMPPMEGGVFYEHGHRMIATLVGFLTIILAIWLHRSSQPRGLKIAGWAALGAVITQGMLGGLTVLYLLPKAISISHACLAQLFFSTTVMIAIATSRGWAEERWSFADSGVPSMRTLAILAPVATLTQIALGAGFRHKAIGVLPHILGALFVSMLLVYFAMVVLTQYGESRLMRRSAKALLWVTMFQVVLGIAAYFARLTVSGVQPEIVLVGTTVSHVATGAMTLALTVTLSVLSFRFVHQTEEAAAPQAARA